MFASSHMLSTINGEESLKHYERNIDRNFASEKHRQSHFEKV